MLAEMREHGGQFVARDEEGLPLAYGDSEELLALRLQERQMRLQDVLVSRVPRMDVSYIFAIRESPLSNLETPRFD